MRLGNQDRRGRALGTGSLPAGCSIHHSTHLATVAALLVLALVQSGCVGLTGATDSLGALQFSPAKVEFGDVVTGAKKTQTVTLTNTGTQALTLPEATIAGTNYGLSGLELPATVEPGEILTFTASFTPTASGPSAGTIMVSSDDPARPLEALALSGMGLDASGPTITTQPIDQSVTTGQSATFSVNATGTDPLSYQWKKNDADITGATEATYTTPATTLSDSGSQYTVTVSDSAGSATSDAATLTVTTTPEAPTITSQPVNRTVTAGQSATFSVTVSGTAPLSYQWRKNGTVINGATSRSYTTPATTSGDSGSQYSVIVLNAVGSAVSNSAVLTVNAPVTITSQPSNVTVVAGQTATFSVTATGSFSIGYQWRKNGANIAGATASSYTTPVTTTADSGDRFSVVVTSPAGSIVSSTATLTVTSAPVGPSITSQPANRTVAAGQTATFTVTASGTAPLSYQWRKNGSVIGGATAASYTTPATTSADNGAQFSVVVSNSVSSVTSNAATLTVNNPPTITSQPTSKTVLVGQTASFSVTATGSGPLSYRWRKNGANINGATAASYTTPAANSGDNGARFTVVVSNAAGSVTSNSATLTVSSAPSITTQPANQTVVAGQTAHFSVTASGTAPLSYQWRKNGANINGATSAGYTTPATSSADNGAQFSVVVSNSVGNATSNAATLTVNAATLQLTANPSSLNFGNVTVGNTKTLPVTISNSGNSNVSINNVALSGPGFSANGVGSGQTLTPGQTATLNVTFDPSGAGGANGSVTVSSNATNSPASITLSGTGVQPVQHSVLLSWNASPSAGAKYVAYRGTSSGGPYTKLNSSPTSSTNYTDSTVQSGTTYFYVVRAVDANDVESTNSNQAQANIPTP